MKTTLLILLLLFTTTLSAQYFKDDKIKHFGAGMFFALTANSIVYDYSHNVFQASLYGLGAAVGIGLGKELYDEFSYGGFDWNDWLATILGGVTIVIPLNILFKRHKRKNYDGIQL